MVLHMNRPASRLPLIAILALASFAAACPPAAAEACGKTCDEQQIGPYVEPAIPTPNLEDRFDPRGKPVNIPGLDGVTVRHRSGAGVWIGEAPGAANLFLKPAKDRLSLDMKLDF